MSELRINMVSDGMDGHGALHGRFPKFKVILNDTVLLGDAYAAGEDYVIFDLDGPMQDFRRPQNTFISELIKHICGTGAKQ